MDKYQELWNLLKIRLLDEKHVSERDFAEIIEPVKELHKLENGYIYLVVDKKLDEHRLNKFYLANFNALLKTMTPENLAFKFITKQDAAIENSAKAALRMNVVNNNEFSPIRRILRPEYTFNNFIPGPSNRYAFLMALKVAEAPHVNINPLYIFGDVGLGKTHLMMATGHYILDNNINANVVYTTATQFAEDYFLASSRKNENSFKQFYDKYRLADVLLVDDIQFLANKTATQEEFFKLFEFLFENNKQIILTSDRHASELDNIMSRLISRFNWGVIVDITKPDFELRLQILKSKLAFLLPEPSDVSEEALRFIAENFFNNIRDLEGALRRFVNYCVSFNISFSVDNAKTSLAAIMKRGTTLDIPDKSDQIETIKRAVAKYYNLSVVDLISASRKKDIVLARHVAIYLIRTLYEYPLKKIGEHFSNRDHASVAHACDKIGDLIDKDWMIKQDIENIKKELT